jgi:hypothetical protein
MDEPAAQEVFGHGEGSAIEESFTNLFVLFHFDVSLL